MIQKALDNNQAQLPPTNDAAMQDTQSQNQPQLSWLSGRGSLLIGIGIGILVSIVGTRLLSAPQAEKSSPGAPPALALQVPAQSVTVASVTTSPVNRTLKATGTVGAVEMIPVMSQATGLQIKQILVDENDTVQAGEVLAYLDDSVLQAQLAQAKANLAQAEARLAELQAGSRSEEIARAQETVRSAQAQVIQAQSDLDLAKKRLQRNQNLEAEGAIARDRLDEIINQERSSQSRLQQAKASLGEAQQKLAELRRGNRPEVITQAQAQLAAAQAQFQLVTTQLKDTRIVAPVRGKIAQRNAKVGDVTSPSGKLFTIIEQGKLELLLKVPETELTSIAPGQKVQITSDLDNKLTLIGKVREIQPTVNEESRQGIIKVDLPAGNSLKPGMFLRGAIITSQGMGVTVPMAAVLPQSDGSALVYVAQNDNTVKAQPIKMGEILPNKQVEILSGLKEGDSVVVKGASYLKDGAPIKVTQ